MLSLFSLHQHCKSIHAKLHKKKEYIRVSLKKAKAVLRMQRCLKRILHKKGPNFKKRQCKIIQRYVHPSIILTLCSSLNVARILIGDFVEDEAKEKLREFLQEMMYKQELRTKILAFHGKIVHLQRVSRVRQQSFRNRTNYLKYYWEVLKGDLSRALMSDNKKGGQKAA